MLALKLVDPVSPDMTITLARILEQSGYVSLETLLNKRLWLLFLRARAVGALGQVYNYTA
jgi:hypothetical protein